MSTIINESSLGNIIIVTGSFVLLLLLIKVFAWQQITGIFSARSEKISSDIDGAEIARQKAEELANKRELELSNAKNEGIQIIEDAKGVGQNKSQQIITSAHEEANRIKDKANQDIEQSKAEALASVKGDVADLSVLLAEKILNKQLDKESQSQLIDTYLDKLGEV